MKPIAVAELIEMLRSMPQDVPVFVEGYETGLDAIHALSLLQVATHRNANEWDGEYREVQGEGFGGTPAAVLLGRRGHRRGSGVGPPHRQCSRPSENESSAGTRQMGTLLEANVFAAQRGCPAEALQQACATHRIFAVVIDGVPLYPAFYVDPRFEQRKLEAITKLLGDLAGGSKWQFFTSAKGSLGSVTPLQALLAGRYSDVRIAALGFSER